jgi:hypothetical protein
MSALTMNIPEPIILPATIIVASKALKVGLNWVLFVDIGFEILGVASSKKNPVRLTGFYGKLFFWLVFVI